MNYEILLFIVSAVSFSQQQALKGGGNGTLKISTDDAHPTPHQMSLAQK
jgi:hypothetical protein